MCFWLFFFSPSTGPGSNIPLRHSDFSTVALQILKPRRAITNNHLSHVYLVEEFDRVRLECFCFLCQKDMLERKVESTLSDAGEYVVDRFLQQHIAHVLLMGSSQSHHGPTRLRMRTSQFFPPFLPFKRDLTFWLDKTTKI